MPCAWTRRIAVTALAIAVTVVAAGLAPGTAAAHSGPADSANARFVVDGYRELLGRDPENAGLDFHLARLASGGARTRASFAYGLLFSAEGSRRQVARAYDELLDRAPDPAGHDYWATHLQGRGVLDLRVLLLSGREYRNRAGGTDRAWIEAMYADVLGRQPDPDGLAYWLERTRAGVARPLIAAGLHLSDEALGRRADSFYLEVLGRAPSPTERAGAVTIIGHIGERGLRARLLASDEAFEPFLRAALS